MSLLPYWLQDDNDHDVVLSTRFRLARNFRDLPFPSPAHPQAKFAVRQRVHQALIDEFPHWRIDQADELSVLARSLFFEMHLISSFIKDNPDGALIATSPEARAVLLVNEEDHIRLQLLLPGLSLMGNWRELLEIEKRLGRRLEFAFHPRFGYLTACLSNVGTGLRASAMLHLPGLAWTESLTSTLGLWPDPVIEFRGTFGEGSSMESGFIQLSNKTTLGADVQTIVRHVLASVEQLVALERRAREQLYTRNPIAVEDAVFRAFGVLRSARLLSSAEATAHLSLLRLGSCLGVFPSLSPSRVLKLLVGVRPAHLQVQAGQNLSPEERDEVRARHIRSQMELFVEDTTDG